MFQIHIQMISHTLKLQIVHITSRLVASPPSQVLQTGYEEEILFLYTVTFKKNLIF